MCGNVFRQRPASFLQKEAAVLLNGVSEQVTGGAAPGGEQRTDAEDGCRGRMHPNAALGFNLAQLRQPQREQRPMKTLLTKSPDKRPSPREQQGAEAKVRGEEEEGWRC